MKNKKNLLYIFLIIFIISIILFLSVYSFKQVINKQKINLSKETAEDVNVLTSASPSTTNIDYNVTVNNRTKSAFNTTLTFSDERCINCVENLTTNTTYNQIPDTNWQTLTLTFNPEIHELHKFKIHLANSDIIQKDFLVDSYLSSDQAFSITPGTPVKDSNGNYTFPNLEIFNAFNQPINNVTVQFTSAISPTDSINLNSTDTITTTNNKAYSFANVSNLTTEEMQEYLRNNLLIKVSPSSTISNIGIKIALSDKTKDTANTGVDSTNTVLNYFSENGHYYKYVSSPSITWRDAKAAAENMTYLGQHGYLATITSADENKFMTSLVNGLGWLGGTCCYEDVLDKNGNRIYNDWASGITNWYWETGPEQGEKFYDTTGTLNTYYNWYASEPNNWGNSEAYLHTYADGFWNDYANNNSSISGYIVEFSESDDSPFITDDKASIQFNINPNA